MWIQWISWRLHNSRNVFKFRRHVLIKWSWNHARQTVWYKYIWLGFSCVNERQNSLDPWTWSIDRFWYLGWQYTLAEKDCTCKFLFTATCIIAANKIDIIRAFNFASTGILSSSLLCCMGRATEASFQNCWHGKIATKVLSRPWMHHQKRLAGSVWSFTSSQGLPVSAKLKSALKQMSKQ